MLEPIYTVSKMHGVIAIVRNPMVYKIAHFSLEAINNLRSKGDSYESAV